MATKKSSTASKKTNASGSSKEKLCSAKLSTRGCSARQGSTNSKNCSTKTKVCSGKATKSGAKNCSAKQKTGVKACASTKACGTKTKACSAKLSINTKTKSCSAQLGNRTKTTAQNKKCDCTTTRTKKCNCPQSNPNKKCNCKTTNSLQTPKSRLYDTKSK